MAGRPLTAIDERSFNGRLGAKIRLARRRRGLTVTQAAEAAGVHPSTWSRWERGERSIPVARIPLVANVLARRIGGLMPAG